MLPCAAPWYLDVCMSRSARLLLLALCCAAASVAAAAPNAADTGMPDEGLHMPYDGHPMAMLLRPTIDARYLPDGLDNEAAIRTAVADGTVREAIYPSLQLADDRAYVWLSQFGRSTLGPVPNTLTRCDASDGFRLLLDTEDCNVAEAPSLHFQRQNSTDLRCVECAALGLPERWQPQVPGAQCSLPSWNLDNARRQYATWLTRFERDIQPFLQEPSEAFWRANGVSLQFSVVPRSRATATLFSMSVAADGFGASVGVVDAPTRTDLLPALSALLRMAEVSARGGLYPEPEADFSALCAEVWYLRLPGRRVPAGPPVPADTLVRDGAPFITVMREGDRVLLTGISRELARALLDPPGED